jgi:hypothetical protein
VHQTSACKAIKCCSPGSMPLNPDAERKAGEPAGTPIAFKRPHKPDLKWSQHQGENERHGSDQPGGPPPWLPLRV